MADEISIGIDFLLENGLIKVPFKMSRSNSNSKFTQSSAQYASAVQTIGTGAHEAIALNDVGTPGFYVMRNLDPSNSVQIGYDDTGTFRPFHNLPPLAPAIGYLNAAPYAQASGGNVELEYLILDA